MEWTTHGERTLYASDWVTLGLVDVEVPDGPRFGHHVVPMLRPAVGVVVHAARPGLGDCVLLLWRHRFITGTWGWEVPAGGVDAGEGVEDAAAREVSRRPAGRPGRCAGCTATTRATGCPTSASSSRRRTGPSTSATRATRRVREGRVGARRAGAPARQGRCRHRRAVTDGPGVVVAGAVGDADHPDDPV